MDVNTINTSDLLRTKNKTSSVNNRQVIFFMTKEENAQKKETLESFENFSKLSMTNDFHYMADSLVDIQIPLIILGKMIFFAF